MNRWEQGRTYDQRTGLREYASRPVSKWIGLFVAWVLVTGLLLAVHLTLLIWPIMLGLIGYVVVRILRETPRGGRAAAAAAGTAGGRLQFNPAPGWPDPPPGWTPPQGWQPHPSWPPAPAGWQLWSPEPDRGVGGRASGSHRRDDGMDRPGDDRWNQRDDDRWNRPGDDRWNQRDDDRWNRPGDDRWNQRDDDRWNQRDDDRWNQPGDGGWR